jgi:hypothetical protein
MDCRVIDNSPARSHPSSIRDEISVPEEAVVCYREIGWLETPAKLLATWVYEKIIRAFRVPSELGSDF